MVGEVVFARRCKGDSTAYLIDYVAKSSCEKERKDTGYGEVEVENAIEGGVSAINTQGSPLSIRSYPDPFPRSLSPSLSPSLSLFSSPSTSSSLSPYPSVSPSHIESQHQSTTTVNTNAAHSYIASTVDPLFMFNRDPLKSVAPTTEYEQEVEPKGSTSFTVNSGETTPQCVTPGYWNSEIKTPEGCSYQITPGFTPETTTPIEYDIHDQLDEESDEIYHEKQSYIDPNITGFTKLKARFDVSDKVSEKEIIKEEGSTIVKHELIKEMIEMEIEGDSVIGDMRNIDVNAKILTQLDREVFESALLEAAEYFIPLPALRSIYSGSLNSIAELRQVTSLFLHLDSYLPERNQDPISLQPFFYLLQQVLSETGGFLRQFLVDDKVLHYHSIVPYYCYIITIHRYYATSSLLHSCVTTATFPPLLVL